LAVLLVGHQRDYAGRQEMKKAISIGAFPADWPLERSLALAREAGFEGIELGYALSGPLTLETDPVALRRIRAAVKGCGLEVASLASGVLLEYNLLSPDENVRATAHKHVRAMLRLASELGTDAILLIPGYVGPIFGAGSPAVADYEAAFTLGQAEIRQMAGYAKQLGVHIAIENVWNKFLTSPLEMRDFVDGIGSPYVGVYFDVANVLRTGYPEHWIRILGTRILRVHFKDFRVSVGTVSGFVDMLDGDVDFLAVAAALRAVGYDGWITAELPARPVFPEGRIYAASQNIERIWQTVA
jgi:L-ribulose-5-phosphate 3-epimerase